MVMVSLGGSAPSALMSHTAIGGMTAGSSAAVVPVEYVTSEEPQLYSTPGGRVSVTTGS